VTTNSDFWAALGAIGTVIAAIGTVATLAVGLVAFRREWRQRRREMEEVQARRVAAWLGDDAARSDGLADLDSRHPTTPVTVLNGSDLPIYRVVFWMVVSQGAGFHTGEEITAAYPRDDADIPPEMRFGSALMLPPGSHVLFLPLWTGGGMSRRPGVEIAFTDQEARHWIRRVDGRLDRTSGDAAEHYHLPMPGVW
jgi:hypothetical protein